MQSEGMQQAHALCGYKPSAVQLHVFWLVTLIHLSQVLTTLCNCEATTAARVECLVYPTEETPSPAEMQLLRQLASLQYPSSDDLSTLQQQSSKSSPALESDNLGPNSSPSIPSLRTHTSAEAASLTNGATTYSTDAERDLNARISCRSEPLGFLSSLCSGDCQVNSEVTPPVPHPSTVTLKELQQFYHSCISKLAMEMTFLDHCRAAPLEQSAVSSSTCSLVDEGSLAKSACNSVKHSLTRYMFPIVYVTPVLRQTPPP